MERTNQRGLLRAKYQIGFFPFSFSVPNLASMTSLHLLIAGILSFLSMAPAQASSNLNPVKTLKSTSNVVDIAGASAKAPLCQILFQKSNAALIDHPHESMESWTINGVGAVARQIQIPTQMHSSTTWITNQNSNIFSEPTQAIKDRLRGIVADYDQRSNTRSAHDVLLVHTLVGSGQISDFFDQVFQAQTSFNQESRGILSIHERQKQSIKSTAVAFLFTFLIAPKVVPLALMPAQYLFYLHQEKSQVERTFQAMAAIQDLMKQEPKNALGVISLDQYTLSRPNILKQNLHYLNAQGNIDVLQENIRMNIPAMRMFLDLLAKSQNNEKLGHHQKLMFDFVFESSEQDEPMLHLIIRTEKPHLYFER